VLGDALATFSAADRLILVLVFRDGLSVRAAARTLGLEHKRVGRRLERLLDGLRRELVAGGVDRHGVLLFLENFPGGGWTTRRRVRPSMRWSREHHAVPRRLGACGSRRGKARLGPARRDRQARADV
jgi:hypothetical protein